MIAAWMLYTFAVTTLLFAGASAAEHLARAIRMPARVVWAAAILAALGLSGRALMRGPEPRPEMAAAISIVAANASSERVAVTDARTLNQPSVPAPPPNRIHSLLIAWRGMSAEASRVVGQLDAARLDVARLGHWNGALIAFCVATSGIAIIWLVGSFVNLRRIERDLASELVDDHVVLVSKNVGPALFGVVRSRIVLPRWVLSLPARERHIILTHEDQHARAFDPALLCAAAIALALQPWNVACWALFLRLRFALEADCDRRVLGAIGDTRRYGELLVAVYERATPMLGPSVAFVERPSELEQRIRRMTRRPRLVSIASAAAALVTLLLSTAAWTIGAPVRWASAKPGAESRAQLLPALTTIERGVTRASATQSKIGAINIVRVAPRETIPPLGLTPSALVPSPVVLASSPSSELGGREGPCVRHRAQRPNESLHMSGVGVTIEPACTIDGDIVMVALDSSRVLVAWRDSAFAGGQDVDYMIFTSTAPSVPANLSSFTTTGHAEFGGPHFYFASPSPGIPAVVFGPPSATGNQIAGALHFTIQRLEFFRRPSITWDVLRQLPTSARCTRPLIIVDGVVIPDDAQAAEISDCFVVGGREIRLIR